MTNKHTTWDSYVHYGYIKKDVPFSEHMEIGEKPEMVANRFTDVEIELNPVEVAVYDVLMGSYRMHLHPDIDVKARRAYYDDFNKGKNWFIENNPQAYFDLID